MLWLQRRGPMASLLFLIDTGLDYTQRMFLLRNKEYKFQLLTLNWVMWVSFDQTQYIIDSLLAIVRILRGSFRHCNNF